MKVTGVLSIRNAVGLGYPFLPVISNLSELCDNVILGVDPGFPEDFDAVESLGLDNVGVFDFRWDMSFKGHGFEIARQMDLLVSLAQVEESDWVVVLQADELLHEDDFLMLRAFMERHLDTDISGLSLERLYFWKDLNTIREDWNAWMVRVFKPGHYSFLAEGTSKDGMYSGKIKPGEELRLPYKIYHYSRVDDKPENISRRVRNLDTFFHPEETLIPAEELPDYDFKPRTHDQFSISGFPAEVKGRFLNYSKSHPKYIREYYDGNR